ncbi:M48 family metalloprotease [Aquisalimonas sp.]|uniref:M48 family metalloprotease n=1 Tax=Aquisalimonas sp. TaxID=1872621 RepID=UPI0025C1D411|nr:M48 family metalloprotease [Aquisalimonas sp.]
MPTSFFERQEQAQRRSRYLVVLFVIVVAGLIALINAGVLVSLYPELLLGARGRVSFMEALADAAVVLAVVTAVIVLALGVSMLRMSLKLRAGGRVVALDLGAVPVKVNTADYAERRLRNVVEEMALAAGVLVPGVYIMREEPGINAFAAGFSPSDAVIVVTRGALEKLNREELQGVVAHEFSHLVNGDTRLNMRLIAIVHGLEVLAITGGSYLSGPPHRRAHSRSARDTRSARAPDTLFFGVVLYSIGLLGVLCSRLIKAAIVRQREWLADAAALQFTRQPEGLAGALKKIAAGRRLGSALLAPSRREVSHMLFAPGLGFADAWLPLFSTHPPVMQRIRELDPGFQANELAAVREAMLDDMREHHRAEYQAARAPLSAGTDGQTVGRFGAEVDGTLSEAALLAALAATGQAGDARIHQARALLAGVPERLNAAAHAPEEVIPLVLYLLLSEEFAIRQRQLDAVGDMMGAEVRASTVHLLAEYGRVVRPQHRLPLLELAFPALREQSVADVRRLIAAVGRVVRADGQIAVHEYALARLLQVQLQDLIRPGRRARGRPRALHQCLPSAATALAVFARHGHPEDADAAHSAYQAGMDAMLVFRPPPLPTPQDWVAALTTALGALAQLNAEGKRCLVKGLVATATHAGQVTVAEAELLRVMAVSLHLPVPLILPTEGVGSDAGVDPAAVLPA